MCIRDRVSTQSTWGSIKQKQQQQQQMSGIPGKKAQKIVTNPVSLLFRFFQTRATVEVWLYENTDFKLEGKIQGFDEFMNIVLDDAVEVNIRRKTRKTLGKILLKGDSITLIRNITAVTLQIEPIAANHKLAQKDISGAWQAHLQQSSQSNKINQGVRKEKRLSLIHI
eukprot:TRINITY_DN1818_c0_g1_i7.p1 TRINITY_DN1818_c0_g1~~TRINITY_DN1818_c0_g1_i7.p1  ORF type:complete len:184 (-),score=43.92 TRINITY_DN1818_c0_g1_i7:65-568(-)